MITIKGITMYDSDEVKKMLCIGHKAYRDLRQKGLLRTITLGGELLTSEEAIQDFLTGRTLPTPSESPKPTKTRKKTKAKGNE